MKTSYLTTERIAMLDSIGMVWDVPDYQWSMNYSAAMRCHQVHGNLNVPTRFRTDNGSNLYEWLHAQKRACQNGKLSSEQIEKLKEIGVIFYTETTNRSHAVL